MRRADAVEEAPALLVGEGEAVPAVLVSFLPAQPFQKTVAASSAGRVKVCLITSPFAQGELLSANVVAHPSAPVFTGQSPVFVQQQVLYQIP